MPVSETKRKPKEIKPPRVIFGMEVMRKGKPIYIETSETWKYYREPKIPPSKCALGTFRTIPVFTKEGYKPGVRLIICKKTECVAKKGEGACPTTIQSVLRSKDYYRIIDNKLVRKGEPGFPA